MGHLIEIFDQLVSNISKSEELRALVEFSITESERKLWDKIVKDETGDLAQTLAVQRKYLVSIFFFHVFLC